jgi:urease accessory protein
VSGTGRPWVRLAASGVVGAIAVTLAATPAGAHVGGHLDGLADGALHPLTGVDHLLAMLAVGAVAALAPSTGGTAARRPWTVVVAFLGGMVAGGMLGIGGIDVPSVETGIVLSVVGLGIAVVLAPRADAGWFLALVAVAGFAHGNAHGAEAPTAANPLLYVLGFVAITAALHAVGAFGGIVARRAPALRLVAGAGVAAVGVLLLG